MFSAKQVVAAVALLGML
ncbi:hypothetical protein AVEN_148648-1, partial [Araneus ventricosus]